MPISPDGLAPYTSSPALLKVIESYRDRGLQTPFTLDVLVKAGVTPTLAPRTLQALQVLDLVDDAGNPTETLDGLRKAPATDYRDRFAEFLRGAYAEVFAFTDPREDSRERVRDAFRSFTPRGQQERMVTLFLQLCAYAGLIDAPPPAVRASHTQRRRPPAEARSARARTKTAEHIAGGETATVPRAAESAPPPDRHPFVVGLIQSLPEVGSVWSDAKRDDWIKAARAVFNMIYVRPPEDSVVNLKLDVEGEA